MGQVPQNSQLLLIGSGRLSRHLARYFDLLNLSYRQWNRRTGTVGELRSEIANSSHLLLAISDSAIESFLQTHQDWCVGKTCVHFSGSLSTPLAIGAHPLMTFSSGDFYDLPTYQKIPFILDSQKTEFQKLLPGLPNPHFAIPAKAKALYHAWCVMSGNFTVILWEKFFAELEGRWELPRTVAYPYLQQIALNLQTASAFSPNASVLTGPLARRDHATIERNLASLKDSSFLNIYQAFADLFAAQTATQPTPIESRPQ
jgi:predicted short-subunit dehydrogenase-like oxidoreductase (DUF2520 family)